MAMTIFNLLAKNDSYSTQPGYSAIFWVFYYIFHRTTLKKTNLKKKLSEERIL